MALFDQGFILREEITWKKSKILIGKISSMLEMSFVKRLSILPIGFKSKNLIFDFITESNMLLWRFFDVNKQNRKKTADRISASTIAVLIIAKSFKTYQDLVKRLKETKD